jgi:hypothetical protein
LRFRGSFTAVLAVALVGAAVQIPARLASAAPTVAAVAGDVVMAGQVLAEGGTPAAGADVYLFDVTVDTPHPVSLAHAKAGSDGSFAVSLGAAKAQPAMAAAARNGGWTNFMALTRNADGRVNITYFSRRRDATGWVSRDAGPASQSRMMVRADQEVKAPAAGTQAAKLLDSARRASASAPVSDDVMALDGTTIATYENVPTTVARVEAARNSTVSFLYGEEADSDIDVAVSVNSEAFRIDGSTHIGNTHAMSVPTLIGGGLNQFVAYYMKIGVNYEDRLVVNLPIGLAYVERVATGWTGNVGKVETAYDGCSGAIPCAFKGACFEKENSGVIKRDGRNKKYAAAVSVAGVTLGATSGWSRDIQMTYTFDIHNDPGDPDHVIAWCLIGSNGWPSEASDLYMVTTPDPPWGANW